MVSSGNLMHQPLCQHSKCGKNTNAKVQNKNQTSQYTFPYELFLCELLTLFQNLLTTPFSLSAGPHPSVPPNGPRVSSSGSSIARASSRRGLLEVCHPYNAVSSARRSGLVSVIRNVISLLPAIACVYDSCCFTKVGLVIPRCEKSVDVLLSFDPEVGEDRLWGSRNPRSLSIGVRGDSGSIIDVSSSNNEAESISFNK